jgi:actin related protein 2/3 complex subunit 2
MILLEPGNRILGETVKSNIMAEGKVEPCDVRLCDFDDVSYHVQITPDDRSKMNVSMNLPCYHQIQGTGAEKALKDTFGSAVASSAEVGYDITLNVALGEGDQKAKEELVSKLSQFKSNVVGGVFRHHFQALVDKSSPGQPFKFDLRADTTVFFTPAADRVVVTFGLDFTEAVDKVFAKVFMQEFQDAKRRIGRAPPIVWGVNPPKELATFGITKPTGNLGFITFAVLPSHLEKKKMQNVIDVMQSFRNYLQYHIKCSKAYFHSRMRARVRELIKVLNRAKFTDEDLGDLKVKSLKTFSGKTFSRK